MHIAFHRHKKSFLIIEMKLHHCITLKKTLEKNNITLYQGWANFLARGPHYSDLKKSFILILTRIFKFLSSKRSDLLKIKIFTLILHPISEFLSPKLSDL